MMRRSGGMIVGVGLLATVSAVLLLGCETAAPDEAAIAKSQAETEQTIRQMDADWVRVGSAKNVDGWMAFYADGAVVLPPNEAMMSDRAAIRKSVADMLMMPGMNYTWKPTKVEVARSGDLGYLYGTYSMTMNDAQGKPVNDSGKILEVWKKQPDGKWKCVADIWNSDLPMAGMK
jgi:ketosteroid isomerase-like protein